jgi:GTPase
MTKNKHKEDSALSVNKGIEQPPSINPNTSKNLKKFKRKNLSLDDFMVGIKDGNRGILSQAITLAESSIPEHQELAQQIIEKCLPLKGNSIRIGITGVPGVGKSTFIESFGKLLTEQGNKIAVLAIDPSSERSKGSILGDKQEWKNLLTIKMPLSDLPHLQVL